jgi:hypothetical protein
MAAQITDDHIATFATESTWDGLADALAVKYGRVATRIALYNALGDPERTERYGTVAKTAALAPRSVVLAFHPAGIGALCAEITPAGYGRTSPHTRWFSSDPGPPMGCHDREKTS